MQNHIRQYFCMIAKRTIRSLSLLWLSVAVIACGNNDSEISNSEVSHNNANEKQIAASDTTTQTANVEDAHSKASPLTKYYLNIASTQFKAAQQSASKLSIAIQGLVESPTRENHEAAKAKWLAAHRDYAATRTFSYINIKHPVLDHSQIEPVQHSQAVRIDQSPLLPGYLDSVEGYPQSGYIYSPLAIDENTLNREHQFADAHYVTLGFHAIEFLLWGETGAQPRKSSAFAVPGNAKTADEGAPDYYKERRSRLIRLTAELLLKDIEKQSNEWTSETGHYPSQLRILPANTQIGFINESLERSLNDILLQRTSLEKQDSPSTHSHYANSDLSDLLSQLRGVKVILASNEWADENTQQNEMMIPAKALRAQYNQLAKHYNLKTL